MSLLRALAALWGLGDEQVQLYASLAKPSMHAGQVEVSIGRATLPHLAPPSAKQPASASMANANKVSFSPHLHYMPLSCCSCL